MTCGLLVPVLAPAVSADEGGGGSAQYYVQPGDTLSQVALQHGVPADMIARANGLANQNLIYAGSLLTIPSATGEASLTSDGASYTVVAGDNLSSIAARFGVTPDSVAGANNLSDQNVVVAGTTLAIPTGPEARANGSAVGSSSPLSYSFDKWADYYGVPVDLLKADAWLESGWQAGVVSPDGAIGIGQLLPETVTFMQERIGIPLNPWVADDNIRMQAGFMRILLDATGWDSEMTLEAYYQGLASVRARGPLLESIRYAQLVESLRSRF